MKHKALIALLLFVAFTCCKKDEADYRDRFVGMYECQVTGIIESCDSYRILLDTTKIMYYKDAYIKDSTALSSLYKEEYKIIIDTLFISANGKSYIKMAPLNPKILGEKDDDFFGQHYASILDPEYYFDISISDNGEFEGDLEYQLRKDNIKGHVFNDNIKFCYKSIFYRHIYDDVYSPVSIIELNYNGKKIK